MVLIRFFHKKPVSSVCASASIDDIISMTLYACTYRGKGGKIFSEFYCIERNFNNVKGLLTNAKTSVQFCNVFLMQ